jgi:hypothetical protein
MSDTFEDFATQVAPEPAPELPAEAPKPKAKAKAAPVEAVPEFTTFRSKFEEGNFQFMGYRSANSREFPGHKEWKVPAEFVERARVHHHVITGRIVEA